MNRPDNTRRGTCVLRLACAGLIATLLVSACRKPSHNVRETWPVMGTFATLTVPAADSAQLRACADQARQIFDQLNDELSIYSPDTPLSLLNNSAGQAARPVSERTLQVLDLSLRYAALSEGRFDPTVAPLVRLWGFNGGRPPTQLPAQQELSEALARTGYRHLILNKTAQTAFLDRAGMQLDLGGIAKGYAVDLAYDAIARTGARNAMVDLGGNIRCLGQPRRKQPWRIGVRNPFDRETIIGALSLRPGMAVATSGHYERFVMIDGRRYSHIIDPRTGAPAQGLAGVTVVSTNAVETDAMSTACFVAGLDGTRALLTRLPGLQVILIPDEQPLHMYVSAGMRDIFTPGPEFSASVSEL